MGEEKQQWKWGVLMVVLLAVFILVVDTTMMNVAINNLVQDLDTTVGTIQSIIAIYALIMASFMLLGSKIGEIIGRKKAFLVGIVIYTAGTITAALSVNAGMLLIGWAILEGIAAAMMMPSTTTFITNAYEGKERAMGFAVWGGVAAAGAAFGPILGGFLTSYASWRWGFGIEAIICVIIMATAFYLTETKPTMKWKQLDIVGCILSIVSMMLIIQAFLMSQTYGFIEPRLPFEVGGTEVAPLGISIVFWIMLTGIFLFVLFIWWQWRRVARDKKPLFNPQVLKNWGFNVGILEGVVQNLALAGMLFIFPIYLGNVHGYEAIDIGIFMMPMSLAILGLALGATKLSDYVRPIWMISGGLVIMIVGNIMIRNVLGEGGAEPSDLIPGTVVWGAGGGLILSQLTNATMGAVKPRLVPDASGMLNTSKQLGTSMGTAFIGGVLMLAAFTGMIDGLAEEPEFEGYDKEEVAIWLAEFMDKMKNGEIGDGNFTPEQIETLTRIVDESASGAMGEALNMMSYTLALGVILLLGGAALYARQLKKKKESLLKGDYNVKDADLDPTDEEESHVAEGETEASGDPPVDEGPPEAGEEVKEDP